MHTQKLKTIYCLAKSQKIVWIKWPESLDSNLRNVRDVEIGNDLWKTTGLTLLNRMAKAWFITFTYLGVVDSRTQDHTL